MSDYIKREDVLAICEKEYKERLKMLDYAGDTVAWNIGNVVKNLPAADVAEVKHGKWIKDEGGIVICSNCGEEHCWDEYRAPYCDQCGAKMHLEE